MPLQFKGAAEPLSQAGFSKALSTLGVKPAAIWCVIAVETSGCGFLPDRRPKILFERHIFHRQTGGHFDASTPDLSNPTAGGYGRPGAPQYDRLTRAIALDERAALMSTSWGLAQIMGFNAGAAGFADPVSMVTSLVQSEDSHLCAMADFIRHSGIDVAMRNCAWQDFAAAYNGPNYQQNQYDEKLDQYYRRYSNGPVPNLTIRAGQMLLMYLGFDPGPIDGVLGQETRDALNQAGAPHSDIVDESILTFLRAKLT
jgi:hypothetical protein